MNIKQKTRVFFEEKYLSEYRIKLLIFNNFWNIGKQTNGQHSTTFNIHHHALKKFKKNLPLLVAVFFLSCWVLFFCNFFTNVAFLLLHNFCGCKNDLAFKLDISPLHTVSFLIFFACKDIKVKNSHLMLVFTDSFFTSLTLKLTYSEF